MLDKHYDLSPVLANYPADCQVRLSEAEPMASSGLSGSRIWRLSAGRGTLCLRRWPMEYNDQAHLRWIHGVLAAAYEAGFRLVPLPIETAAKESVIACDGYLWQLEPWLAGTADAGPPPFRPASAAHAGAALKALAEFHGAIAMNLANRFSDGPPPGILRRLQEMRTLQSGGINQLAAVVKSDRHVWPELADRAPALFESCRLIAPHVAGLLEEAANWRVAIHPCIRDIHREHVLFEGDRVTGVVDFGAMQPDHLATDIARLLGSLAGDNAELWQVGMQAFQQVRPLGDHEQRLVEIYRISGPLLGGVHWIKWVFDEGREFENRATVLARFDEILTTLARWNDGSLPRASIIL